VSTIVWHIVLRLRERGTAEDRIESTLRILAPLEFSTRNSKQAVWNSYFSPRRNAVDGQDEYPCLAKLTSNDVEEWATLTIVLKRAVVRAHFADAIWELGKRLGSTRRNLHKYAQLAAELYLEAATGGDTPQRNFSILELLTRGICLALQLRRPQLVERGFRRMVAFADAAELAHIGVWMAPFDRLIGLKGLSDSQRQEILDQYEKRLHATIAGRDLYRMMMAGSTLARYFHNHRNYTRAKQVTLAYGEAMVETASGMNATLATHHIAEVLEAYRQVGLREDAERVRFLLEARGKDVIAEMKQHRVEVRIDLKPVEKAIAERINVSHPFIALYRLAAWCAPQPGEIKRLLDDGGFVAHRLMATAIIGDNGLTVSTVGTYDQDEEGRLVMEAARTMNLNVAFFLSGIEDWEQKFDLGGVPDTPTIFDCPLIPADRVSLYREGLAAFEAEDYVKCIHVLVPQIENSLRELLKVLDVSSTKTDEEGGFELKNMNDVLHEPRVRESLDEKLWYFLKVLYIDKRGMNLRNLVAHGILPVESFNRVNAALVLQSTVFLTMIRPEALFLPEDDVTAADPNS
jgi:hypothetical protein